MISSSGGDHRRDKKKSKSRRRRSQRKNNKLKRSTRDKKLEDSKSYNPTYRNSNLNKMEENNHFYQDQRDRDPLTLIDDRS